MREGEEGGRTARAAAEHGAVGLTGTAALEHAAQGVRINAVGPGRVVTPLLAGIGRESYGARAAR
ncbi:SDR family oxidoreductase [Streptomyces cinereoruber]|uniref:SDR family oxidoreductase n=1 Tax=Streptomyces cinereoruber TaxID=67260 RepID=UPI0036431082